MALATLLDGLCQELDGGMCHFFLLTYIQGTLVMLDHVIFQGPGLDFINMLIQIIFNIKEDTYTDVYGFIKANPFPVLSVC